MPVDAATREALAELDLTVIEDAPLAKRCTWRVGGPADAFVLVPDLDRLARVQAVAAATDCPLFVLGAGSNLLVADSGIRGLVVQLTEGLADSVADGSVPPRVTLGGGLKLVVALARARKQGWTGLEAFAGIPGTVGGAVFMNAGSRLGETRDALAEATVVLRGGEVRRFQRSDFRFAYRESGLPRDAVVADATFQTSGEPPEASAARVDAFLAQRKATQPLDRPSCGSTFRNPAGDFAGRLIEKSGLKGYTIGGAQVSEKHANFILNLGDATAVDIRRLIEHIQDVVDRAHGVHLVPEVHLAGDWSGWESR